MRNLLFKLVTDPANNSITYSKNYRIFRLTEPVPNVVQIISIANFIELNSNLVNNLIRQFRWSKDGQNWSLWVNFEDANSAMIDETVSVHFEFKFTYDNSTYAALAQPVVIEEIQLTVSSDSIASPETSYGSLSCSAEGCPVVIADREASFNPYGVDSAIGIARELSLQTNKIFGHEVVYFKTEPDRQSGDFIFKEWTLYKTTNRKCVKVMVPDNIFPDSKPVFNEFGVDFEVPFEIHIDHTYFQSIFGVDSQPRKRDYLYFPLTNRMYEIQGSYLHRGFMMEPIYWKVQLTKFHPNIDMLIEDSAIKTSLDNVIMTTDELFGEEAKVQTEDALMKQQYSTISKRFDEVRERIHPNLRTKILDVTYNYAPLIEHYYDLSNISPVLQTYTLSSSNSKTDQYLSPDSPNALYAYEESEVFLDWLGGRLNNGDTTFTPFTGATAAIKLNGPKDSFTAAGRYVLVEGYKALGSTVRKDLVVSQTGDLSIRKSETAVIYKEKQDVSKYSNMTFSALIKFNQNYTDSPIIRSIDNNNGAGLAISSYLWNDSGTEKLNIIVSINSTHQIFQTGPFVKDTWYAFIVQISNEFSQISVTRYSFQQDPANIKNYNKLIKDSSSFIPLTTPLVSSFANYSLMSGNYSIANIRLFKTMVQEEDHDYMLSQLFIRDESLLAIIDNTKPQLNVPFIAINR
jgi:hypothetical protein